MEIHIYYAAGIGFIWAVTGHIHCNQGSIIIHSYGKHRTWNRARVGDVNYDDVVDIFIIVHEIRNRVQIQRT